MIQSILEGSNLEIKKNIKLLAQDYKEKFGRVVCTSCGSDVSLMLLMLKNFYNMSNFRFKAESAQYKNKASDGFTISNATMTDEKAIEFLKTNPERIRLFSHFPEGWEDLIQGEDAIGDDANAAAKATLDAQNAANAALAAAAAAAADNDVKDIVVNDSEEVNAEDDCDCKHEDANADGKSEPCVKCLEKKKIELMEMKLSELRIAYPEIRDTSKESFVNKVLNIS